MLEMSHPGGVEYRITMTRFDGTSESWGVRSDTFEKAQRKCWEWALKSGYVPPKWWQWWRWKDPLPPEGLNAAGERS